MAHSSAISRPRSRLAMVVVRLCAWGGCWLIAGGCHLSEWAGNGFKLGPDYQQPSAMIADDWIDANDPRVLPQPPLYPDWWAVFQDPVVNNLIETASQQNLSLRQAGLRVVQARANRAISVGNLFPQRQEAFGDFARVQNSETEALPAPLRSLDTWEIGLQASWEIDVWGRFRRSVEAAEANLEASVRAYDALLISLIAEVATAYVDLRTFQQRLEYARQNVKVQQSSYELATARFDEGKTTKLGVYLANANLNATQVTIPQLETGLRQANNRLCTLLGLPTADLAEMLGAGQGIPQVPAEIVVGIPAELLRRRPDVRQAERRVAAQSAQIGIAQAELYPSISVTGEVFQASEDFSDLFRSASSAGSIGPSFAWNILNYGRLRNNVRLQDARLRELIANYQNTVLEANQEVEDALVAFLKSQEEVRYQQANESNLHESLQLLLINFEEGSIDFSPVFVLQGSLRVAQDQLAEAQGRVLVNMIAVYRALGGGWQIRCPGFQPQGVHGPPAAARAEPLPAPAEEPSETGEPDPLSAPAPSEEEEQHG